MERSKIEMHNITKCYGNTVALNDVSVQFETGKVNAIIGKNGSGKSTLVKILAGVVHPDKGKVMLDGEEVHIEKPTDAFGHGIVTVYQELNLIPYLSVAENILLGRQPKTKYKTLDKKKTIAAAQELLDNISPDIPAEAKVMELAVWQQQVVEIAKAMSYNPKVLILDEPTSSLAQHETEKLFEVIRKLRKKDVAILYISHRLQELSVIADTLTILRDGRHKGTVNMSEVSAAEIVSLMFGKVEIQEGFNKNSFTEEIALELRNLTSEPYFRNVNLKVRKGEVVGIAGMLGAGRSELVRSVFGADAQGKGEIYVYGRKVSRRTPAIMKQKGIGYLPEDRKRDGLILPMSCRENLVMTSLKKICSRGVISKKTERELVQKQVEELAIKLGDVENAVSSLSGGNQQKIVVGNWLNAEPKIIIFDEPTRGIDINAKQQIFNIIQRLGGLGISTIFISSELEELFQVCHRILIMKRGEITGEVFPQEYSVEELYATCMGE
ncbi:monosaccharide-transporting ATPase [Lachnospiraceae bacterium]|uniref:sugar ABC transporter ATP-binding protein n=1 Tax=Extibacter sp. GGCC_0201 TaxID=2731209 RepID=UPI001FB812CB|nr:sugar ABC transporter ATP-binding protein [Extibacter sp. GGCC_0201]BDF35044.1 monosaccharide-transporting ATPase [Lachnospiraceae bacterium]BDF39045.1 monosaccharide-transporting ATPase [Lachnospiraceae bacterium]